MVQQQNSQLKCTDRNTDGSVKGKVKKVTSVAVNNKRTCATNNSLRFQL